MDGFTKLNPKLQRIHSYYHFKFGFMAKKGTFSTHFTTCVKFAPLPFNQALVANINSDGRFQLII